MCTAAVHVDTEHPILPIEEIHYQFLSSALEKVSFKNKDIYLLGDFNINL